MVGGCWRRRRLRLVLPTLLLQFLLLTFFAPTVVDSATFDLLYYPNTDVNASQCPTTEHSITVSLPGIGCHTVFDDTVLLDCSDDYEVQLTVGFGNTECDQEGSEGYTTTVIPRECSEIAVDSALGLLLLDDDDIPKGSGKGAPAYSLMSHSPCLTPLEQFEENLGAELLDIFGLNNITNATDPVLYEVKEILFTYGIVFVSGMVLLGLMLCICGFKFFWLTLFISGFAILGYLGYFAWMQVTLALNVDVSIVAKGILPSFLVCGVIGGILAWRFLKLGIFVLGATFGGALGYLVYMTIIQSFWDEPWGLYVIVGGCGLIFGVVFIFKHKFFIVVCSALIGSFALVSGVSFFIGYYPSMTDIETVESDINAVTWQFWVFFSCFAAAMVASIIIQKCIKKKDEEKKYKVDPKTKEMRSVVAEENPFRK